MSNSLNDLLIFPRSFDPDVTPTTGTIPPRRYGIRADVHYSSEENIMTAMFELPGVQRSDLRITMSVCPFSRVRQVSISGISRVVLPLQGHSVRERKFGEFFRTLAIPPETKVRCLSTYPCSPLINFFARSPKTSPCLLWTGSLP